MLDFRISSPEEMEATIREAGIIPFFANAIPGYSIQELTAPGYWFGEDGDSLGPWDWKIHCVQCGDIAYGKFLCGGKASFATVEWYREWMNVRRTESVPDSNGSMILQKVEEQGSISIKEVRALLGVKKGPADAAVSKLQHQCRLLTGDITRVYSGPDLSYKGWQHASFCTPEALFGEDAAPASPFPGFPFGGDAPTLKTSNSPRESLEMLRQHLRDLLPSEATPERIRKVLR